MVLLLIKPSYLLSLKIDFLDVVVLLTLFFNWNSLLTPGPVYNLQLLFKFKNEVFSLSILKIGMNIVRVFYFLLSVVYCLTYSTGIFKHGFWILIQIIHSIKYVFNNLWIFCTVYLLMFPLLPRKFFKSTQAN